MIFCSDNPAIFHLMGTENCGWKILFWNCISGGIGSEYQFCISLEFSTNLGNSSFKISLALNGSYIKDFIGKYVKNNSLQKY